MKNFIKLGDLKLQRTDMQNVVGGSIELIVRYAVITPLYGIKVQPYYGITIPVARYAVIVSELNG